MQNIIGIDIGGSHITLAQVNPDSREIISSSYIREHVDSLAESEEILSLWTTAIKNLASDMVKEDLIIGIAMPGPFDYNNGISLMQQGKFINIFQVNIKEELAERLAISVNQIHFLNDAAAFMEGEVFGGCVQGFNRVFGVTLGTGLGSTFYNNNIATDEDLWDSEFRNSISENYLATRWFENRYQELTGETISGTKELLEKPLNIQKLIFDEYADSFSEFIIKYVKNYEPEVLVIGGNIAKAYPYFEECFTENLIRNNINLPVKISTIFEDAAILGAASYAIKQLV